MLLDERQDSSCTLPIQVLQVSGTYGERGYRHGTLDVADNVYHTDGITPDGFQAPCKLLLNSSMLFTSHQLELKCMVQPATLSSCKFKIMIFVCTLEKNGARARQYSFELREYSTENLLLYHFFFRCNKVFKFIIITSGLNLSINLYLTCTFLNGSAALTYFA